MPLVRRRILGETKGVVLPAEDPQFAAHAARRRSDGIGLLVNPLGESILGDDEARRRVDQVLDKLRRPDVGSRLDQGICAGGQPRRARLRSQRRADLPNRCARSIAPRWRRTPHGFVNLDMEEYRDLQLTVAAFTKVLDEPEFDQLEAGIVLQAYLPDSHAVLEHLGEWAAARRRQRRRRHQDPDRQGRQPGDGVGRGRAARLDRRAVPDQGRCRCELQVDARVRASTRNGTARFGSASPATTCSTSPGRWCMRGRLPLDQRVADRVGDAGGHGAGAEPRRAKDGRLACCCTHPSCSTTRSTPASPISLAASTRTRRRRTSCGRCSRSRRDRPSSPSRPSGSADRSPSGIAIPTARRRFPAPAARPGVHATNPTVIRPIPTVRQRLRVAVQTPPDRTEPIAASRASTRSTRSLRPRSTAQPTWSAAGVVGAATDTCRGRRRASPRAFRHDPGDGRRGRQGCPRGRPRGQRGDRLRQVLRHRSASMCSSSSEPRARRCRRVASSSWRRHGTSRTPFLPAACSPRWRPATR